MNKNIKCFLFLYIINLIFSESIWNITFFDQKDSNHINPNIFNISKGNYNSIKLILEYMGNEEENITHINTTIKLNHSELKIFPNEININTEKSLIYNFDLGIPCNLELDTIEFDFEIEDNTTDLFEIKTCKAYLEFTPKIIDFSILNKDGITDNLFGKIYIKQDVKNFEKIEIEFGLSRMCIRFNIFQNIENIIINEYSDNNLIYYSKIETDLDNKTDRDFIYCEITASIKSEENNKCFIMNNKPINVNYIKKYTDLRNKVALYHNSIVSSYIDNNKYNDNSLSLFFYKENNFLVSYCVIQDLDSIFLSDYEILNQRLNNTNYDYNNNNEKNDFYLFNMIEFNETFPEANITFNKLPNNKNYKIKCVFDFFDNKENLVLTYGEGMQIPIKINFNETKSILGNNCYNDEYMKNKNLDTRYCDIISHRLIFMIFYDSNYKYRLNNFNLTDFDFYRRQNNDEKIEHIKNIINNINNTASSINELLGKLSDYLFIIDCQEKKECQEEKNMLYKDILIKYGENDQNIDLNNEQSVINDILLFNNIIENSDTINYDNFEILVNNVFNKKNFFFTNSTKKYNHYLTNYFFLIYDKLISIITKFKSIYPEKLEIDKELNIYKNKLLIDFQNYFMRWISHGMINREDKLLQFCHNLVVNFRERPVVSKIEEIIDTETIKIIGFNTDSSKELYEDIFSVGAISYKQFPLFPLNNIKSEAVTLFLYTELRENFENEDIAYSEAFKVIFKKKSRDNYCYLWNNDYKDKNKKIVNNFVSTEYLNKKNNKYDINCISRIMISPMTIILGQKDLKGNLYKEGISFLSLIVIILITLSLIIITLPFLLSKYYKRQTEKAQASLNQIN